MTTQSDASTALETCLKELGFGMSYECRDPGAHDKPSVWTVTIWRGDKGHCSFTSPYTMGCAHRHLPEKLRGPLPKGYAPGAPLPHHYGRMTLFVESLRKQSVPDDPTLPDVFWSLWNDASGVRQGQTFAEWASDYGMDDDSIKAKASFDTCRETWAWLVRCDLSADETERLDALCREI